MILDQATASKIAKVCRLFASDKVGERAAAAAMADKLLQSCGLAWCQVFAAHVVPPDGIAAKIDFVASNADALDAWQRGFVASIRGRRSLSLRQRAKLDELVATVRASQMEAHAA
jgi:hypothetical protein